jgi:hypothetical protein
MDRDMPQKQNPENVQSELEKGIALSKCRQCGCMKGALEEMRDSLAAGGDQNARDLRKKVDVWLGKTQESLYT